MIKIICVGKIKEKYLVEAVTDYLKRLNKYIKVQIIEVNNINLPDKNLVLKKEKELILKNIDSKDYIVTLELEGNNLSSIELSKKIEEIFIHNFNITFIIGGSYGLDKKISEISNYKLSFSKLTFPHQLFRVLLLEQLYRSFKISNNEKYHK